MAISRKQLVTLSRVARLDGQRLININTGKTLWAGLGNRSGLHSYADVTIREKWEKSGEGLVKKLLTLEPGTVVEIKGYQNKNRDTGTWVSMRKLTITDEAAPACYHLKAHRGGYACEACGMDLESSEVSSIF
jgi:hypothetical protein